MLKILRYTIIVLLILINFAALSQSNALPGLKEKWLVAGEDTCIILRIDNNNLAVDMTSQIRSFTQAKVTGLLTFGENKVLIGTWGDFLWLYNNGTMERIERSYGITDSLIVSISGSRNGKRIYVETHKNGFVTSNPNNPRFTRFTKTLGDNPFQDSILKDFKRWRLSRILWIPVRKLTKSVSSRLAKMDTDEDSTYRKLTRLEIDSIKTRLAPADIILERRDGLLSNYFIPVFWTHSAIYVGSLRYLNAYFAGLPLLNGYSPASYIRKHYPDVYRKLLRLKYPIIESVTRKGVIISPLRNVTRVDYFALIRTNLSKEDKFLALIKAFEYHKQPYDFGFDLSDSQSVVCSGLIYKSFIPSPSKNGLHIPVKTMLGSPMMFPGDLVKKFDSEFGTAESQLQLILFFDSTPDNPNAFLNNAQEFRKTWRR